jgi:hypothetical protein
MDDVVAQPVKLETATKQHMNKLPNNLKFFFTILASYKYYGQFAFSTIIGGVIFASDDHQPEYQHHAEYCR